MTSSKRLYSAKSFLFTAAIFSASALLRHAARIFSDLNFHVQDWGWVLLLGCFLAATLGSSGIKADLLAVVQAKSDNGLVAPCANIIWFLRIGIAFLAAAELAPTKVGCRSALELILFCLLLGVHWAVCAWATQSSD